MKPHFEAIFNGEYDIKDIAFKKPPFILDIGANMGAYTVWAKNRFPNCHISAFEPCKLSYNILVKNVNALSLERLHLYNLAVSSDGDNNLLYYSASNPGANSLHKQLVGNSTGSEQVALINPDDLDKADIIKVDTEGCEKDILDTYLADNTPTIVSYEWHRASDGEYLFNLMKAKGYTLRSGTTYSDQRGVYNWLYEQSDKLR